MIRGLFIALSVIIIFSCKSKEKESKAKVIDPNCSFGHYSKNDVIAHYDSTEISFNWLKIKTKIDAEYKEQSMDFTTSFRINKDKLIYASITKAGIPFAKVLATPDSIKVVDLFHKTYLIGAYTEMENLLGITIPFSVLQNSLLGNPCFLYEGQGVTAQKDGIVAFGSADPAEMIETTDGLVQIQNFSCDSLFLQNVHIQKGDKEIGIQYSNREDINGFTLNKNIELVGNSNDKRTILAQMEITRVKKFSSLSIPFEIPSDYAPMGSK